MAIPAIPMGAWGNKDPGEKLRKGIDWTADMIEGDSITSPAVWTVIQGSVVLSGEVSNATICQLFIEGGIDGEICLINCKVNTTQGAILEGTMRLDIRSR